MVRLDRGARLWGGAAVWLGGPQPPPAIPGPPPMPLNWEPTAYCVLVARVAWALEALLDGLHAAARFVWASEAWSLSTRGRASAAVYGEGSRSESDGWDGVDRQIDRRRLQRLVARMHSCCFWRCWASLVARQGTIPSAVRRGGLGRPPVDTSHLDPAGQRRSHSTLPHPVHPPACRGVGMGAKEYQG